MQQQEQMGQAQDEGQLGPQMGHSQDAGHKQEPDHEDEKGKKENEKPMAVAVITPSGTFPNDDDYRRTIGSQIVAELLALAAETLKLTSTSDWVAFVNDKELDLSKTFKHNGLSDIVEIEWHKREGGGGA